MVKTLRNEKAMLSPVHVWLASQGFFTKYEFRTPWGICDLVGVKPKSEQVLARIAAGQAAAIGSLENVSALLNVPSAQSGRSVSLAELASQMGRTYEPSRAAAVVATLKRKRLISVNRNQRVQRNTPWLPFVEDVVAIELKLARVEEALLQATHHKVIAEKSYVALPSLVADRVMTGQARNSFLQRGVGLIALSETSCDVVLPPARSPRYQVNRTFQTYVAERFWAEVLKAIQH